MQDDRGIEAQFPTVARNFFLLHTVQTDSRVRATTCLVCTWWGCFYGCEVFFSSVVLLVPKFRMRQVTPPFPRIFHFLVPTYVQEQLITFDIWVTSMTFAGGRAGGIRDALLCGKFTGSLETNN